MNLFSATSIKRRSFMLALLVVGMLAVCSTTALAQTDEIAAVKDAAVETIAIPAIWWTAPIGGVLALVFAHIFFRQVRAADPGDEKMQAIANHVTQGAYAYLKRQYKIVVIFFIVVGAALFVMGRIGVQHEFAFIGFLTAGFFSGLCGFLGMKTATMASNRTTQGVKESLNRGLTVAFRAGAVMGLVVVGFALLDISLWFLVLTKLAPMIGFTMSLTEITVLMLTFAMGASSQALFARVGGGIFTKAADVGADLVGKVEAGIPEDDPRNPATIADNVGDNVGDVAGMGADLYESYYGSILATGALGVSAAMSLGLATSDAISLLTVPMVLAGIGILLSILGVFLVRTKDNASIKQLMRALDIGVFSSSGLIIVAAYFICQFLLGGIEGVSAIGIWGSIVTGLLGGIVIGKATEYSTSYDYKPTQEVVKSSETGAATVIISGIAEGMKSTWMSLGTIIFAIMLAYGFAGGFSNTLLGLYGIGIAAVGMLATLGITLATDAYGPIADNAGGNAEMSGQDPEVREKTDVLDSLGNTTAAVGKGFAIGSAALTALALMASYVEQIRIGQVRQGETAIVQQYEADAVAGQGVYLGGKKLAVVQANGETLETTTYMVQSKLPANLVAGSKLTMPSIAAADEFNVQKASLAYIGDEGEKIAIPPISIVPVKKASLEQYMYFYNVTLMNPKVLCGMFSGVLLVFLFSALTIKAVGRAAFAMVKEVRRQFREIAGILEGTTEPDYARCVEISTISAQREMILPSILALGVPILVGLVLDVAGVMGMLAGGLTCGFAMAIFMANAGGSWDNAKKYIETGALGGKGSDNHKAAVVGDTVGDPFKDTSGPSLNILIKLMSMVSVVFAGLIVKFAPQIGGWLGIG